MHVECFTEAPSFRERALGLLLSDEARHNLALGILSAVRTRSQVFPEFRAWMISDAGRVVCAALRTPPHNLVLVAPAGDATAIGALVAAIDDDLPGVVGAVPEVDTFAHAWSEHHGVTVTVKVEQRIYALDRVAAPQPAPGAARVAEGDDTELLVEWMRGFAQELRLEPSDDLHLIRRNVEVRLADPDSTYFLWEVDGMPVSLAGVGGPTPTGIRINPVYTPPAYRRRGYAAAVTAAASQHALDQGRSMCFLYTDRANPTSNGVYVRIGYQPVCDSRELVFASDARSDLHRRAT